MDYVGDPEARDPVATDTSRMMLRDENGSSVGGLCRSYLLLCGYSAGEISEWSPTTRLFHDLCWYGDRAEDDLLVMRDECGVSFDNFVFERYFPEEFSFHAHIVSYEDVLRNDTDLFLRYRRELVARGVFEMPESLGRSHIAAAHTDDDIDRSLEAAEEALRAALG